MSNDVLARNELSVIDESKPFASYIKTILGQVGVNVWDRFTEQPAYVVLKGDPRKQEEGCIVDVWSARENSFFQRNNHKHFAKGVVVAYTRPENTNTEPRIEQFSDEQLKALINGKFVILNKTLNEIESIPVVFRMLSLASEMEKSGRIMKALQARLSELQMAEYGQPAPDTTDEEE